MWFKVHRNVNDIRKQIIAFIKKHIIILFTYKSIHVSGFRWWDHKPLLRIPVLVVGSWGSWFLLLVSFWSTADWSDQNCLISPHFFLILFFIFETSSDCEESNVYHLKKYPFHPGVVHRPSGSCCSYVKRSGSAGVRHSIYFAFSVGVLNWFVREKDDYMFLYESYYLFSYINTDIRKCTKKSCPLRHKWLHQQNRRMRDKHVNITWVADFRTTEEDKQTLYDV
jgi:hypothetical protein